MRARSQAKTLEHVYSLFPAARRAARQAAGTLSGGEQQMLAIGRCLMGLPRLIMFDEPSLGLAPAIVQEMFRIVRRLNEEGLTILLVEQNVMASLKIAHRGYVLENGRIELHGAGATADQRPRAPGLSGLVTRRLPLPFSRLRYRPLPRAVRVGPGWLRSFPTTDRIVLPDAASSGGEFQMNRRDMLKAGSPPAPSASRRAWPRPKSISRRRPRAGAPSR